MTGAGAQSERRPWRLYAAVAAAAVVVYLGALANRFAMDDLPLIVQNPLVHAFTGLWRAFGAPYWPPELGGAMYRPLPIASWAFDGLVGGPAWYHFVNVLWHAATAVAVAALTRRLADDRTALLAGLLFAIHPVHVEAVANIAGRAELMAAVFVVLAAYAALVEQRVGCCAAAWALGLLCKENAIVLPAIVAWAWAVGLARPARPRQLAFVATWLLVAVAYLAIRAMVLRPYGEFQSVAPIFLGSPSAVVRLTAVAALADVARLLVFPLTLRVDYSPAERTVVTSLLDPRAGLGVACFVIWAALLALAWRKRARLEAFGLGWIGIAFLPVSNLIFPAGFLVAERTLYLPSVGMVLAAAGWLARRSRRVLVPVSATLVALGAARTALRVPVWRDNPTVTLSILEDSPRSYVGPKRMAAVYLDQREPAKALAAVRAAAAVYPTDPITYLTGAVAAFAAGQPLVADSMLVSLEGQCHRCLGYYQREAATARGHGYTVAADSLLARARALEQPMHR